MRIIIIYKQDSCQLNLYPNLVWGRNKVMHLQPAEFT